ncbi:TetR/AcrR family transcriptional regulator [Brevundimonas subvibrioides]|uniref:TetR/AcrR family transcriptional regulator n=1 Tax=Brevundimonas subvibrioides TaxID=74313 RepID=UPI0022B30915|nr:TetR/AcrR family transcriptional regulator [Brevundimonas subvibrioides]
MAQKQSSQGRGRPADPEARAARRLQILQAAHRCFVRKGFHATTTAEISSEAGISIAGLYQYFPSKEDLILELVEQDLAFNAALIDRLLEGDDFMAAAETLLNTIVNDPQVEALARVRLEILAEASRSSAVADRLSFSEQHLQAAMVRAILVAQSRRQIDPQIDADELATAVCCLCDGIFGRLCLPAAVRGSFVDATMKLLRRATAPKP